MRARDPIALLALAIVGLALSPLARGPWRGGEQLVANASSASWQRRLAVWSTDAARAGAEPAAWYAAVPPVARRYVRWVPSAMVSLQVAVFGTRPWALRLVTLALHLTACWLGLRLLARFTGDADKAAAVILVVGLHGAAFEVVAWEACQAIAVAAVFSLAAATFLLASRTGGSARTPSAAAAVLCTVLAMTSYEAAVALPIALVLFDRALPASNSSLAAPARAPAWVAPTLLGLYPLYLLVAWVSTRGSTHASYRAEPAEAVRTLLGDLSGYLAGTLLYLPTGDRLLPRLPFLAPAITAATAAAAVAALLVVVSRRGPARSLRWRSGLVAGVAIYLLFLAPPLVARATVSVLNRPSMRQIYLPLAGAAILLALAPGGMSRRRWTAVAAVAALAATASVLTFVRRAPPPAYERLRASVRSELADADPGLPVLVVGRARCVGRWVTHEYGVEYDAGARPVIPLLPLDRDGSLPALRLSDPRTVVARAAAGFAIDVSPRIEETGRVAHRPPPIASAGTQRAPFGRIDVLERDGQEVLLELAITLDRPAAEHVLLLLDECRAARRLELAVPGGASAAARPGLAPDALDSVPSSAQRRHPRHDAARRSSGA